MSDGRAPRGIRIRDGQTRRPRGSTNANAITRAMAEAANGLPSDEAIHLTFGEAPEPERVRGSRQDSAAPDVVITDPHNLPWAVAPPEHESPVPSQRTCSHEMGECIRTGVYSSIGGPTGTMHMGPVVNLSVPHESLEDANTRHIENVRVAFRADNLRPLR